MKRYLHQIDEILLLVFLASILCMPEVGIAIGKTIAHFIYSLF